MTIVYDLFGNPQVSLSAPALFTWSGRLYIAWRGTDDHINLQNLADGNQIVLSDTTSAAPAVVEANLPGAATCLYLAWTGTDAGHHLNVASTDDIEPVAPHNGFRYKVTLPQTTDAVNGPALAAGLLDGAPALNIAWTGTDAVHRVNLAYAELPRAPAPLKFNSPAVRSDSSSQHKPALTGNGDLTLAWTGENGQLIVANVLANITNPLAEKSNKAPSLAQRDDLVPYLAWTGTDNRLNVAGNVVLGPLEGPDTVDETSYNAPSLIFDSTGTRYIAWTGTEGAGVLNYEVV